MTAQTNAQGEASLGQVQVKGAGRVHDGEQSPPENELDLIPTHIYGPPFISLTNPDSAIASLVFVLLRRHVIRINGNADDLVMEPGQAVPGPEEAPKFWEELRHAFAIEGIQVDGLTGIRSFGALIDVLTNEMRGAFNVETVPVRGVPIPPAEMAEVEDTLQLLNAHAPDLAAALRKAIDGKLKRSNPKVGEAMARIQTIRQDGRNRTTVIKKLLDQQRK